MHLDGIWEAHSPIPSILHSAGELSGRLIMPHNAVQLGGAEGSVFALKQIISFARFLSPVSHTLLEETLTLHQGHCEC